MAFNWALLFASLPPSLSVFSAFGRSLGQSWASSGDNGPPPARCCKLLGRFGRQSGGPAIRGQETNNALVVLARQINITMIMKEAPSQPASRSASQRASEQWKWDWPARLDGWMAGDFARRGRAERAGGAALLSSAESCRQWPRRKRTGEWRLATGCRPLAALALA